MKQVTGAKWRNWSGLAESVTESIKYPASIEDVVQAVKECARQGSEIRVVGSGHSFTPLVPTNRVIMSLDEMQGIAEVDEGKSVADVWAGTKLFTLGETMLSLGWGQENLGDTNKQSIAGAVSTGTHGTGVTFGNVATQVVGITVVTASGEVLECSETENSDIFKAMQISLGSLGIIVRMKLRVVPAWTMHFESRKVSFAECMNQMEQWKKEHRHFEFFIFPYSDQVQVKFMNQTNAEATKSSWWTNVNKLVVENGVFWVMSEACRLIPKLSRSVSRLSAKAVPLITETGPSNRLFATPRLVKFSEMEYNIPAEHMQAALEEAQTAIEKNRYAVHFPLECRFARGDDIWLSPAYGRDSAYIAVHMYKGMPYKQYFEDLEQIFLRYGGRPHWGKLHTLKAAQLAELYPKWDDFQRLRAELDPNGMFLNDYLRKVFLP